jgi:hypothetical protein
MQKEAKLKQQHVQTQQVLLSQMAHSADKRRAEINFARTVPHIHGNEGYPRLYEPSPEQQRDLTRRVSERQREDLLAQVATSPQV